MLQQKEYPDRVLRYDHFSRNHQVYTHNSLLLLLVSAALVFADTNEIRYTADMDRLPVGADISALGDAGVVLPGRSASSYWNPSAAAYLDHYMLSVEGADLYGHLSQHGCFSINAPVGNNNGVSINYLPFYSGVIRQYDTIPEASGFNGLTRYSPKGYFRNYHHLLAVSIAQMRKFSMPRFSETALKLPFDVAYGVNLKAYTQLMNPWGNRYMGLGYNFDIGATVRIGMDYDLKEHKVSRELFLAAAVRDVLPTDVIWIYTEGDVWMYSPQEYREPFSRAQYYGISFTDKSNDLPFNWTAVLSLHKEYSVTYHGGVEVEIFERALFRGGVSDGTPVIGAGVTFRNMFLDYTFRFDELAFSYARITAGIHFRYKKNSPQEN